MKTVYLAHAYDIGLGGTYRSVAELDGAGLIVHDVPDEVEEWQVAVLANGTKFLGSLRHSVVVMFDALGWDKEVRIP